MASHYASVAQLKVYRTCEIIGWAGGGGVSRVAVRLAAFILLKSLSFNEAGLARLTGYAARPTLRTEYKPAAQHIVALSQQMRCKRVPHGVACRRFSNSCPQHRFAHRLLQHRFVQVMPSLSAGRRMHIEPRRRKNPIASPTPKGRGDTSAGPLRTARMPPWA